MQTREKSKESLLEEIGSLAKNNKLAELKELLNQCETRLNGHYWDYFTNKRIVACATRDAILAGHEDIVKLLLEAGLSPDDHAYEVDNNNFMKSLIYFAVKSGKLNMVKLLVEHGAKIYLTERDNRDEWNENFGLRTAVIEGNADIVDYLLECRADANGLCGGGTLGELHGGTTFLARAAMDGNTHIVESLIKHGSRIPSTLNLIHEKIYTHGYKEYMFVLEHHYSEHERTRIFENAFSNLVSYPYRSKFHKNYSLTPEAETFFSELNKKFHHLDKIKNHELIKNDFLQSLIEDLWKKFEIVMNEETLKNILNSALNSLEEFDKNKNERQCKADDLKNAYVRVVKTCLDYAMGCDFEAKQKGYFSGEFGGLSLLQDIDVSDMNFIGVSVAGKPVTRDDLQQEVKSGSQNAIITTADLKALNNDIRKTALTNRLREAQAKKGLLVNKDGFVNLIPLNRAAAIGDIAAVKSRIQAGVDPNLEKDLAIVAAAENGHTEIVKLLFDAHTEHSAHKTTRLISEAKQFISSHSNIKTFSVAKGQVQKDSIPFLCEECQIILPGNKKLTSFIHKTSRFDTEALSKSINAIASETKTENKNFIGVIQDDGSIKCLKYDNSMDRIELKKMIGELIELASDDWRACPAIFTNNNNFDVIEELIITQYQKIDKRETAIIKAIEAARKNNHTAIVEFLQDKQDVNQQDEHGNTLLHKAVEGGDLKHVLELIQKGADVNIENKEGKTPLNIATKLSGNEWRTSDKHTEIIEKLLEKKADPNKYKWSSPLELAFDAGNVKAVEMLLPVTTKKELIRKDYTSFEDKEKRRDPWYVDMMFTALHKKDCIALLTLLKQYGADFNVKSKHDTTLSGEVIDNLASLSEKDDEAYFAKNVELLSFIQSNGKGPQTSAAAHLELNRKYLTAKNRLEGDFQKFFNKIESKETKKACIESNSSIDKLVPPLSNNNTLKPKFGN